ncbi:SusD/RagB family nutrient-binding outer membrane lipoprotein [Olivibacter sp. SDN3]|uniref:SusD/RagB family nutrient-binding outer membrane lipoprotein n=1 Tax=Olivibacter sp. SDN3 TaxID=2764720 RepID=UPI001651322F|nr:SusD/RagB family nutrient-binding outer membrane lipoprotein [Olivibacter sp. SDN3]QNL49616.1 SusD/RagB family nutrient-binding outer membrane lipoprotein [Olivibacter sp. SDN3]
MKNIKYIIASIAVSVFCSACNKFLDVNNNPNAPVEGNLPLSATLPGALVATANEEAGTVNQLGSFWAGYLGTTSEGVGLFRREKEYNGPLIRHQRDGIHFWENGYVNLEQYRLLQAQAAQENQPFYIGISKVMQALVFMRLVDFYNNIPFDDALQGTDTPSPSYNTGQEVYERSVAYLSEAVTDFRQVNEARIANSGDIMFDGEVIAWIKFANTLKLRALIRQSETGNMSYINTQLASINQNGAGYLSVGEHALIQPGYLNTAGKLNPFWETYYQNVQGNATNNYVDLRPTVFAIEQYSDRNDPRLALLYVPVDNTENYQGVLFGNPNETAQYNRSNTSPFRGPSQNNNQPAALFKSSTQPTVLLGSFESLFLQAEAAQRGWIDGDTKLLYENAISESFAYMEVQDGTFADYIGQNLVNFDATSDKIERIIEQKWLALNFISGVQAWNDYRRLGLPNIPNSLSAPSPSARPLRLMYPETEMMTNGANVSAQGDDGLTSARIWWDVE